MKNRKLNPLILAPLALLILPLNGWAQAEFDETKVIIEINATDGDVGFHAKYDAGAWWKVMMWNPHGKKLLKEIASGPLREQGMTENFFESAEPLCVADPEDPDEMVVTLAEFLSRFPAGNYDLVGSNNEGEYLLGSTELTYNIPAAPDASAMEDEGEPVAFEAGEDIIIAWEPGTDLGGKCDDVYLVMDGIIPDPASVEVVAWEAAVEPECDIDFEPELKFTAQLSADQTSVTVPGEFMSGYLAAGCHEFKFEIGAIEESGNQTFTEGEFEVESD